MKKAVLLYGVSGGFLIALLKAVEYRFLVFQHSFEIYGGIIAAIFAGVGIWLGLTLTKTKIVREEVVVVKEVRVPLAPPKPGEGGFVLNEGKLRELAITAREHEILQLIAEGLSNQEIATKLFVSENTVKTHAARLFDKLGVNKRIKAVEAGRGFGLIP